MYVELKITSYVDDRVYDATIPFSIAFDEN